MKAGLTLNEMAAEITRQHAMKADYLVDTRRMQMEPSGSQLFLNLLDENGNMAVEPLEVNQIAHRQIGTGLNIPATFYDRMLESHPDLLAHNVNTLFQRESSTRMLRTLGGTARAFLSSRYRRIDNMEIANIVLPVIAEMGTDIRFESCQITDSRMYIKVVNPRLEAAVSPGDIVQSGMIISNSEVGHGSVSIQPLIYRLVCSNGMVVNDARTRRNHVGRTNNAEDDLVVYSQETEQAIDRAFVLKIQDTVRSVVDQARFDRVIGLMKNAKDAKMNTEDVPALVKLACREFKITEEESGGVLQHLIEGKDLSLYGLSNAVTRYAQDVESYDRSTKLESIGYSVLTMHPRLWTRINQSAAA